MTACNNNRFSDILRAGTLIVLLGVHGTGNAFYREIANHEKYIRHGTVNYSVSAYRKMPHLLFVTAGESTNRKLFTVPVLFIRKDKQTRLLEFNKYRGYTWNYVGVNYKTGKVWAILDYGVEAPGWELEFLVSHDGGSSWRHQCKLKKFYYQATVARFSMDNQGKGELVLRLDDYGAPHKQGYYRYTTGDGCKTWSKPVVTPDANTPVPLKHDSNVKKYLK